MPRNGCGEGGGSPSCKVSESLRKAFGEGEIERPSTLTRALALLTLPLLLALLSPSAQAQTGTIRGRIIDTISGTGVAYAVLQVSLDDSIRGGTMADSLGNYVCVKVPRGNIVIETQAMGYNPRKLQLQLNAARLELTPIYLSPSSTDIEEVRVTTQKPTVTLRPNRKEVTLPASEVAAGVPLDQLLLRTPGFTLNSQGVVQMTRGSFSILINGRPSGISAAQLNTIDPSTIERIEVITAPSVEYRAGSQGGILNIITREFKPGFNGTVQALGGFEGSSGATSQATSHGKRSTSTPASTAPTAWPLITAPAVPPTPPGNSSKST